MQDYLIHPFEVQHLADCAVLVTGTSVVRLTNETLARGLVKLITPSRVIPEDEVDHHISSIGLPAGATRDFLVAQGVLRPLGRMTDRIASVNVVSPERNRAADLAGSITGVPTQHACSLNDIQQLEPASHELSILLLERYSEDAVRSFYKTLSTRGAASGLIAYFRMRTVCISSLFNPEFGTPCHFCHVGWESRALEMKHSNAGSISALMRVFEAEGLSEIPAPPLQKLDWPIATGFIAQHVQRIAAISERKLRQDELTDRVDFDLESFRMLRSVAVHWPGCDCQYLRGGER